MESVELELTLRRQDAAHYALDLRFSQSGSDTDVRLSREGGTAIQINFDHLRTLILEPDTYGRALGACVFADANVQRLFVHALSVAQTRTIPLRLRLCAHANAPELHDLLWERLRNPLDDRSLLTSEQVLFSRYLSSADSRPVKLRARGQLRALVLIANPANLAQYAPQGHPLASIDVEGELGRASAGLGDIPITALAGVGQATLTNLCTHLGGGYDILYLVCHGALVRGEPHLWLEDAEGRAKVVSGSALVERIQDLATPPRLIVLVSCQSSGKDDMERDTGNSTLAALGPRLAEVGVPAVLAMQGNISIQTVERFMPVFFQSLQRDGQIDLAVARARSSVRDRWDAWVPVLFMRLKSGRLWYVPGFADGQKDFQRWLALLNSIQKGRCTPILGPGLGEALLGSTRELAQRWAEAFAFPMEPHEREDLPQIAQYLAVTQDEWFLRDTLEQSMREEILRRYGGMLPGDLQTAPLDQLIDAAGVLRQGIVAAEAHRVLAELPFPIYISANADTLLTTALQAAGKTPQVLLCPWNEDIQRSMTVYDDEPSTACPLVYHLFGHLGQPESLVLTEDDYFDFLIGVTRNNQLIPDVVREALADTALLFLGFQIDDWNFRVLFRSLMSQEGRGRRRKYTHVAVQINPDEERILAPERARQYLETYFEDADISIYWGSADDFIRELQQRARQGSALSSRRTPR